MAEKFDVTGRLAEERPTVDAVGGYVSACRQLGYTDADLTARPAALWHWYGSEDGLDLRLLSADCEALEAAVSQAERALAAQDEHRAALAGAWSGRTAASAAAFLGRHGEASARVVAGLRAAADAAATLRDDLWAAVDAKVAATQSICGEAAERADWRAAAESVTTGAGDRAAASELIDQQVKPFVDGAVRSQWLAAMQATASTVAASYDSATRALTAGGAVEFAIPGDLGPPIPRPGVGSADPLAPADGGRAGPAVGATVPAAVTPQSVTGMPVPQAAWSMPAASPPPGLTSAAPAPVGPAMPPAAPPSDFGVPSSGMGGGVAAGGGALGGFGRQLADLLGGLLPTGGDGLGEPSGTLATADTADDVDLGDPPDDEDRDQLDEDPDEPGDEEPVEEDPAEDPAETVSGGGCEAVEAVDAVTDPTDTAVPEEVTSDPAPPAPAAPPPPPAPVAGETPCEIAANELPQAGE